MTAKQLAALFDMDGVLVDSYAAHFASWRDTCAEHGIALGEAEFARGFGRTSAEIIAELWPEDVSAEAAAAIDAGKEAAYREAIAQSFPHVAGAVELVDALRDDGFALAVGSSGPPENVAHVLDALGRRERFSAVVTGRDVARGKPDPQVFTLAAEKLGVAPQRCVVIEDASVGIEAAHAAGMKCIGLVSTGRTHGELAAADWVVDSLREVTPRAVRELLANRL